MALLIEILRYGAGVSGGGVYVGEGRGPSGLTVEHARLSRHDVWCGVSHHSPGG
eukprot:COSAG02_NODE_65630_length_257_cov_1.075949_1_plen_53_part_01